MHEALAHRTHASALVLPKEFELLLLGVEF
jgi:hypothetical protein